MTVQEINNILDGLVGDVVLVAGYHIRPGELDIYYYIYCISNGYTIYGVTEHIGDIDKLILLAWKAKKGKVEPIASEYSTCPF